MELTLDHTISFFKQIYFILSNFCQDIQALYVVAKYKLILFQVLSTYISLTLEFYDVDQ